MKIVISKQEIWATFNLPIGIDIEIEESSPQNHDSLDEVPMHPREITHPFLSDDELEKSIIEYRKNKKRGRPLGSKNKRKKKVKH